MIFQVFYTSSATITDSQGKDFEINDVGHEVQDK